MLAAPPGYGKFALARAHAAHVGPLMTCTLPVAADGEEIDLVRPVVDALVARDAVKATRSAVGRLAQRRERAAVTSRDVLRREWPLTAEPDVFVLHDPAGTLATPGGADLLAELIGMLPPLRVLVILARLGFPPALEQIVGRRSAASFGADRLALTADEFARIARESGLPPATASALFEVTRGWPMASRLLVDNVRREPQHAGELLDAVATLPHRSLLAFAAHRTITKLPDAIRDALIVATLLGSAAHVDLIRVLGDTCDDAVFARLEQLPFIDAVNGQVTVHHEIGTVLRTRFDSVVRSIRERTLHALTGDGKYVAAAQIALDAGDITGAAAIVDGAPPYTAAPVLIGDYERIIERIDRTLITRFPNLWIATIPYRSFAVDVSTYVREAETVYYCLAPTATLDQRAAVLMLLASAYVNVGRTEEADRLMNAALDGFARENTPSRAAILNFVASVRGIEGRFELARSLAAEAARISPDQFGETQRLHYIEAHEAAYRGQQERVVVIVDELMRRRAGEDLPLYSAYAAASGAIFSWVNGDDEAFARYVTAIDDAITPGLEAGLAPIVDAARGRPVRIDDGYHWPAHAAMTYLYRLGAAIDAREALEMARAAVLAADQRRDPWVQILAHTALYVLDSDGRDREAAVLQRLVAAIESPELRDAVNGLIEGRSSGILSVFVKRRVLREHQPGGPLLAIELLRGRVTRGGEVLRLTDKEFEFLALLASTRGALARDRVGEALWEHLEPEERPNSIKVLLYRIRKKLGDHGAVIGSEGRYRLSPAVEVDLRQAETIVRERSAGRLTDDTRAAFRTILASCRDDTLARYERFDWAQPLLARIYDVLCAAGIALAGDALELRNYDDAIAFAGDLRAIDPFNELACETTVRVLLARGDVDGARREFRRYEAALANELGATPSARLAELVRGQA